MVDADSIISKVVPLAQGGEWFDRLHDAEPGLIKVVLEHERSAVMYQDVLQTILDTKLLQFCGAWRRIN